MKLSSKLIAKILTLCGISLTCTACYGIPGSPYMDNLIEGRVTARDTGMPIEGIKVNYATRDNDLPASEEGYRRSMTHTDEDGKYVLHTPWQDEILVIAEDVDGAENGGEFVLDTRRVELKPDGNYDPSDDGRKTVDFALYPKQAE